jgi:hypothetical protein
MIRTSNPLPKRAFLGCLVLIAVNTIAQTQSDPPALEALKDPQGRLAIQVSKRVQVKGLDACSEGRQIKLTRQKDSKTQKDIDRPGDVPLMQLAASTGKALVVSDAKCVNGVVEGTGVSLEPAPQPAPDCKQPLRCGTPGCP